MRLRSGTLVNMANGNGRRSQTSSSNNASQGREEIVTASLPTDLVLVQVQEGQNADQGPRSPVAASAVPQYGMPPELMARPISGVQTIYTNPLAAALPTEGNIPFTTTTMSVIRQQVDESNY